MSLWERWFSKTEEEESTTFTLPDNVGTQTLTASPNSSRLAYAVESGGSVAVNGRSHRRYNEVAGITFSADSQHVTYAARKSRIWFVVRDEAEYEPYDLIGKTSPVFSPDSNRVAYTALKQGSGWIAVADGKVIGAPCEGFSPGGILFSPDSSKMAYVIKDGDLWAVVVNGDVRGRYQSVMQRSLSFSPDSRKLAWVACISGRGFNGQWVGEASVIVDGDPIRPWPHDERTNVSGLSNEVYFSPNSERIAYWVKQNGKWLLVIDGTAQRAYDGIVSGWPEGHPECARLPDYGKTVWRSNKISFSPDSLHYAYAVADANEHVLVYDGQEKVRYPRITNNPIVFSPDSKRVAFSAERDRKQFIVLDWTAMEPHYGIAGDRSFSPDSQHFAYMAMERANAFSLVIGAKTLPIKGGPVYGANLVWDDSLKLHTLVADGQRIAVTSFQI